MDYGIFDVLKLIGSLGVFLYGMKLMSESLQKLAGNKMRQILTAMTSNRVTGVLTGLFITALIQSSSATTVMSTPDCWTWSALSVLFWEPMSAQPSPAGWLRC